MPSDLLSLQELCVVRIAALLVATPGTRAFPGLFSHLADDIVLALAKRLLPQVQGALKEEGSLVRVHCVRPFFRSPLLVSLALSNLSAKDVACITHAHFPCLETLVIANSAKLQSFATARLPSSLKSIAFENVKDLDASSIALACAGIPKLTISSCNGVDLGCAALYEGRVDFTGRLYFANAERSESFIFPRAVTPGAFSELRVLALHIGMTDEDAVLIPLACPNLVRVHISHSRRPMSFKALACLARELRCVEDIVCAWSLFVGSESEAKEAELMADHSATLRTLDLSGSEGDGLAHALSVLSVFLGPGLRSLVLDSCKLECGLSWFLCTFGHRPQLALSLQNIEIAHVPILVFGWQLAELDASFVRGWTFEALPLQRAAVHTLVLDECCSAVDVSSALECLASPAHPLSRLSLRASEMVNDQTLRAATAGAPATDKQGHLDVSCTAVTLEGGVAAWRDRFPGIRLTADHLGGPKPKHDDDEDDFLEAVRICCFAARGAHSPLRARQAMTSFIASVDDAVGSTYEAPPARKAAPARSEGVPAEWAAYCCRCMACARLNTDVVAEKKRYTRAELLALKPDSGGPRHSGAAVDQWHDSAT